MSIGISSSVFNYSNYGNYNHSAAGNYGNNIDEPENYNKLGVHSKNENEDKENNTGKKECKTCKERKYQDGSNDPGVSFKSAQSISPNAVASAVKAHEYQHVRRNQAKAMREGSEVINQNVQIKTDICPECGRTYVSGGLTTTTVSKASDEYKKVSSYDKQNSEGTNVDTAA